MRDSQSPHTNLSPMKSEPVWLLIMILIAKSASKNFSTLLYRRKLSYRDTVLYFDSSWLFWLFEY
jgi:hypothetical protein